MAHSERNDRGRPTRAAGVELKLRTPPPLRRRLVAVLIALAVLLGVALYLASSDESGRPHRSSGSTSPVRLTGLDGGYVLAGESPYSERLFRVDHGRLTRAAGAAVFDGATGVTARGDSVIVGFADADGRQTIRQVRDGRLTAIGIASGFAPALSDTGALAWASSDVPSVGVTSVFVRDSLRGAQRSVDTFADAVLGDPLVIGVDWAGADLVVGIVKDGVVSALRYRNGTGSPDVVAELAFQADERNGSVVAGGHLVVLAAEYDNVVAPLTNGAKTSIPDGRTAVCITDSGDILTELDGELRLIPAGSAGSSGRAVGRLPAPLTLFDVACPA